MSHLCINTSVNFSEKACAYHLFEQQFITNVG